MKQLFILAVIALGFVGCAKQEEAVPPADTTTSTNATTNVPANP